MVHNLAECFEACAGKLGSLPFGYKKWKTLPEYRSEWSFIRDSNLKQRIAEAEMAFDYLLSLHTWLQPVLTIRNMHNLLCVVLASSIYDAAICDWVTRDIGDQDLKKWLSGRMTADQRIDFVKNKGLLRSKTARAYLKEMNQMRNLIHLNKLDPVGVIELGQVRPEELRDHINSFKPFLRERY